MDTVTPIPRKLNGFFTENPPASGKLLLEMQGAFVIRLGIAGNRQDQENELVGRVEEVDTGKTLRFRSGEELLRFLRDAQLEDENNRSAAH